MLFRNDRVWSVHLPTYANNRTEVLDTINLVKITRFLRFLTVFLNVTSGYL